MNTGTLLRMAADGMGDRVVVGSRRDGLSATGLLDAARRVAAVVGRAGAERLVSVAQHSPRLPARLFGTGLAGVPFVPVNYRLADDRLRAILARTAPALAVVDDDAVDRVAAVDGLTVVPATEFEARVDAADPAPPGPPVDPDTVAVLLYTSGTTGEPKAAVLRHRHLAAYVLTAVKFLASTPDHAALISVPPYHVAGIITVFSSLHAGRRMVFLPQFEAQRWVDADGWFATRDGGWLDDDGFLFVEGRLDDVIVRGGENVSPGEVEDALLAHPAVAEAGVVGLPDDEWGETVAAAVVLEPGADVTEAELQDWVRARLRSARTPTVVRVCDALPYNETGKLLRRVLRRDLAARPSATG